MSEKEILEGNKLIAKFMGIYNQQLLLNTNENIGSQYIPYLGDDYISNLKFHKSFDWLMPVVEKIGSKDYQKYTFKCKEYISVVGMSILTPIEEVFERVVEFIKWYNLWEK